MLLLWTNSRYFLWSLLKSISPFDSWIMESTALPQISVGIPADRFFHQFLHEAEILSQIPLFCVAGSHGLIQLILRDELFHFQFIT